MPFILFQQCCHDNQVLLPVLLEYLMFPVLHWQTQTSQIHQCLITTTTSTNSFSPPGYQHSQNSPAALTNRTFSPPHNPPWMENMTYLVQPGSCWARWLSEPPGPEPEDPDWTRAWTGRDSQSDSTSVTYTETVTITRWRSDGCCL